MKPVTKFHHAILAVSKKLKPLSQAKINWAKTNFWKYFVTHYNNLICTECTHKWKDPKIMKKLKKEELYKWYDRNKSIKCPNCKSQLKYIDHSYWKTITMRSSYVDRINGMIVLRTIEMTKSIFKDVPPRYAWSEITNQFYCLKKKKYGVVSVPMMSFNKGGGGRATKWEEMEVKNYSLPNYKYHLGIPGNVYPYWKIPESFKKRGIRRIKTVEISKLFYDIMFDSKLETLIKAGADNILKVMHNNYDGYAKYWNSLKIGIRNNYFKQIPKGEEGTYHDLLKMLKEEGKDMRNPKFVCPDDIHEAHQACLKRKNRKEAERKRKLNYEKKLANARAHEKRKAAMFKKMKPFESLLIEHGNYFIQPIVHLDDLEEESIQLCHCAYQNAYEKNKSTILLSCRYKGSLDSTAEVNIESWKVIQCRGFDNKITDHSKTLVNIINAHLNLIQQCLKPKSKKKQLEIA